MVDVATTEEPQDRSIDLWSYPVVKGRRRLRVVRAKSREELYVVERRRCGGAFWPVLADQAQPRRVVIACHGLLISLRRYGHGQHHGTPKGAQSDTSACKIAVWSANSLE